MKHRNGVLVAGGYWINEQTCGPQQPDKLPCLSENEISSSVHAIARYSASLTLISDGSLILVTVGN